MGYKPLYKIVHRTNGLVLKKDLTLDEARLFLKRHEELRCEVRIVPVTHKKIKKEENWIWGE